MYYLGVGRRDVGRPRLIMLLFLFLSDSIMNIRILLDFNNHLIYTVPF